LVVHQRIDNHWTDAPGCVAPDFRPVSNVGIAAENAADNQLSLFLSATVTGCTARTHQFVARSSGELPAEQARRSPFVLRFQIRTS
jgi:hypothetical protein